MEKNEKKSNELTNSSEFEENFYIEELETRLEMSSAPGGMTNKLCWVVVL